MADLLFVRRLCCLVGAELLALALVLLLDTHNMYALANGMYFIMVSIHCDRI